MNRQVIVLVVDDESMIRDCISAFLEDEGCTVITSVSAEEALLRIGDIAPAVCITDMLLPGMNGESFILNAHEICPGTHFLIHTGALYILSDELRAIGMTPSDVLLKPVHDLSLIMARITCLISDRSSGNA